MKGTRLQDWVKAPGAGTRAAAILPMIGFVLAAIIAAAGVLRPPSGDVDVRIHDSANVLPADFASEVSGLSALYPTTIELLTVPEDANLATAVVDSDLLVNGTIPKDTIIIAWQGPEKAEILGSPYLGSIGAGQDLSSPEAAVTSTVAKMNAKVPLYWISSPRAQMRDGFGTYIRLLALAIVAAAVLPGLLMLAIRSLSIARANRRRHRDLVTTSTRIALQVEEIDLARLYSVWQTNASKDYDKARADYLVAAREISLLGEPTRGMLRDEKFGIEVEALQARLDRVSRAVSAFSKQIAPRKESETKVPASKSTSDALSLLRRADTLIAEADEVLKGKSGRIFDALTSSDLALVKARRDAASEAAESLRESLRVKDIAQVELAWLDTDPKALGKAIDELDAVLGGSALRDWTVRRPQVKASKGPASDVDDVAFKSAAKTSFWMYAVVIFLGFVVAVATIGSPPAQNLLSDNLEIVESTNDPRATCDTDEAAIRASLANVPVSGKYRLYVVEDSVDDRPEAGEDFDDFYDRLLGTPLEELDRDAIVVIRDCNSRELWVRNTGFYSPGSAKKAPAKVDDKRLEFTKVLQLPRDYAQAGEQNFAGLADAVASFEIERAGSRALVPMSWILWLFFGIPFVLFAISAFRRKLADEVLEGYLSLFLSPVIVISGLTRMRTNKRKVEGLRRDYGQLASKLEPLLADDAISGEPAKDTRELVDLLSEYKSLVEDPPRRTKLLNKKDQGRINRAAQRMSAGLAKADGLIAARRER